MTDRWRDPQYYSGKLSSVLQQSAGRCGLCGRKLDNPDDPLSVDCGGDCRGCMVVIENDLPADFSEQDVIDFVEQLGRQKRR